MKVQSSSIRSWFRRWIWLGLGSLLFCPQQLPSQQIHNNGATEPQRSVSATQEPQAASEAGKISGRVTDQTGANITGASVRLMRDGQSLSPDVTTDEDGKFYFFNVPPGSFQLAFSSPGLASREIPGVLQSGESYVTPVVIMTVATQVEQVTVTLTTEEIATAQIKEQEKQRVFGVIPNFYVSYDPHAAPLQPRHKFDLAWKTMRDPVTFAAVGAVAGAAQAANRWSGYGQGAEGYAKRYGATYGDVFIGTYLGGAVLPTILKQDPRYFHRGTGSSGSRFLYALRSIIICKGDNGHWQPNYSEIGGNFAAGAISNIYYPARNRNAAGVVVSTAMIRLGEIAVANIFNEFFSARLTPGVRDRNSPQP